ncbi:Dephospho-CoA kinase [Corynebacterium pelargi]|uniref:Dephospho-CoA kinase n=2 Tax=Corynebacterium pelargi TaxID=1471400 RepID=A0A410W954_9CORY|nr:Dephospho-CoA kinase [Corynebacterium pelargi]
MWRVLRFLLRYNGETMKIGLTGGIGSGKSTVARLLREQGANIIDADQVARDVVAPGSPVLAELAEAFGQDIIESDGSLRRQELAKRAFRDEASTAKLNAITHPAIAERIKTMLEAANSADEAALVVLDHPLLLETNSDALVDRVIVVDVPADERIRRLVAYRGLEASDAKARIERQMPDEQRRARADYLVDNSGDEQALEAEVAKLWEWLHAVQ